MHKEEQKTLRKLCQTISKLTPREKEEFLSRSMAFLCSKPPAEPITDRRLSGKSPAK